MRSPLPSLSRRALVRASALALPLLACNRRASEPSPQRERQASLDELFKDLKDQRGSARPISPEERATRRKRLATILQQNHLDAWLCEPGRTMRYLTGVDWGLSERLFGLVVTASGEHFWICPHFEVETARLKIESAEGPQGEIVPWDEHEYPWKPLAAALAQRRVERVALDPVIRLFVFERLSREMSPGAIVTGRQVLQDLRGVKDAHEIELLRTANVLTQQALAAIEPHVKVGMRGSEVSELIQGAMRRLGLTGGWDLSLIGPDAALPHGGKASVTLEKNQFLLIDCGGTFHDYQSDITRTWMVDGKPDADQQRAWDAVHDAQRRVFEFVAPGKICGDVDRVAREAVGGAGFGTDYRTFWHRLGHGIGMEGHEDPYFDSGSTVKLEPGMTFSNEPGLYVLGKFGIRLEDILVVTAQGCEPLGTPQKTPLHVAT